jgi:two-component system sensor histidine kinase DesK
MSLDAAIDPLTQASPSTRRKLRTTGDDTWNRLERSRVPPFSVLLPLLRSVTHPAATTLAPPQIATDAPIVLRHPSAYGGVSMWARRNAPDVDAISRLASAGALAIGIAVPTVTFLIFACYEPLMPHWPAALLATCLYLPLHLRHIAYGLRGERPRGLPLTLLAMALIIIAVTALLGPYWLNAYAALAASVLVTTRPRFSFPALSVILVAVVAWAVYFAAQSGTAEVGNAQYVYEPTAVLDRAMMVFVPVWLVGALRRMQTARQALADEAVELERRQVDSELELTIGIELEDVVSRAERALAAVSRGSSAAVDELQPLVAGSRHALAEARGLIGRYKHLTSEIELDKAASLLRAAGIDIAIELPREGLPPTLDPSTRSSLRANVAALLREQPAGPVVLRVVRDIDSGMLSVGIKSHTESVA